MENAWTYALVALLPALVVFLTAFFLLRQFFADMRGELREERIRQMQAADRQQVLPLRLQAYERLALFLERISPGSLVLRVHKSNMTSGMLHQQLLATVREELDHNVTQQIYVSPALWQKVRMAKEETIRLINIAYEQTGGSASGTALSQKIFELVAQLSHVPSQEAMITLKEEVRRLF